MATTKTQAKSGNNKPAEINTSSFLFGRENFMILFGGIALMIIGYFLMSGGRQKPNEWNTDEIYSFTRISLSSIFVIGGFVVVLFAILKKRKA